MFVSTEMRYKYLETISTPSKITTQEGFSRQSQLQQIVPQHCLATIYVLTSISEQSGLSNQQVFNGFCSSAVLFLNRLNSSDGKYSSLQ